MINPPKSKYMGLVPGISLCFGVTAAAYGFEAVQRELVGKGWIEPLVLAILIGTGVRSLWTPNEKWGAGIAFSARSLLEVAVVLLGASVSAATILTVGPALLGGIAGVVVISILLSFGIGRLLGLPTRMALLIACGNSICGNSAIAAVAPVIGARNDDVAASIAFTAVLGVIVVLGLPLLGIALGLSGLAFGAFAGLTVYAVPQVITAASPLGTIAVQMGTVVKLVRVLMLGPTCLALSLVAPRLVPRTDCLGEAVACNGELKRPGITSLVPWFIIGFVTMLACRALGLVPTAAIGPIDRAGSLLTTVSMAALGLGVDMRTVAMAGGRVTATVILSLLGLFGISLALLSMLHLV